ncbi:MAG: hypothetical protein AAFZ06_14115, partial [Pseudomonadota bacterium]
PGPDPSRPSRTVSLGPDMRFGTEAPRHADCFNLLRKRTIQSRQLKSARELFQADWRERIDHLHLGGIENATLKV